MTEIEMQRALENAFKNLGMNRGGSIGSGGGATATGAGVDLEKELRMLSTSAKDVDANIKKLNKTVLPFSGSMATASRLHSQMARDLDTINQSLEDLEQKLDKTRDGFDKMTPATKAALEEEQKKLKAMKATVQFETQKRESVDNVFGALGNISNAYQEIARASVAGMQQITSAVVAGGSGFNLLGAAAEYQADMAKAQANMGATAMQSVGQSMQGLGIAGQMAGGALNFLAQQVQHNAELRRAAAGIRNNLFMQMGEKFSKSFMAAAGAGAHFAHGADGMNAALNGSRITLAEFGDFVKRNNEHFVRSGMSMEEMTKRVGATSAAFKKSGLDNALMRMGIGYEQQSDMIAETVASMETLSQQSGRGSASQKEIEQATLNSARHTAMMAGILGEEAAQRKKANQAANQELVAQIAINNMSKKYGPEYANTQNKILESMTATERQIMQEMIASNGQVRDAGLNVMLQQSPAMAARMRETYNKMNSGQLKGTEDYLAIQKKTAAQEQQESLRQGQMASATVLGGSAVLGKAVKGMAENVLERNKFLGDKVDKAVEETNKRVPKTPDAPVPKPPEDKLGTAIVDAADTMNKFQKDMETYVVKNLPAWSAAMQSALKKMKDAYEGKVGGLNPLADKFAWLTDFMQKYGLVIMLAVQAIAILVSMSKLASSALGKLGAAGEMAKLKAITDKKAPGPVTSTKTKSGEERFYELDEAGKKKRISADRAAEIKAQSDTMEAPGGKKSPGKGIMSKLGGVAKLAGGVMAVANIATTAFSAFETQQQQQAEYEKAKASGDKAGMAEARAAQGEAIGGAAGGVLGAGIGFALGGPIGAAVGSYLGEMAGGALGKYIGPYWDDMSEKAGKMWDSTSAALSKGWNSLSTSTGNLLTSLWKGITDGWTKMTTYFGQVGTDLWNGIKKSPVGQVGSYIISGITGAATGMAKALMSGLQSVWDWMKTSIGNIIPDWMKNAANKVGNAVSNAYDYVTGNDKPKPAAPPPPPAAKPAAAPAAKPATAQPQAPSATTNKAVPPQAKTTPPPPPPPAAKTPTTTTAPAAKPPEVSKSGQVTEKDIPRLLQENLKLAEYQAKGTQRMVDMLAAMAENGRRTASATEKMSRQG
jgi:hypothetical protein